MDKKELRRLIRSLKQQHSPSELHAMSCALCERVVSTPQWRSATTILLYHALPDEVDTTPLLEAALSAGKQVLLPVVVDAENMVLRVYSGAESMSVGSFGILEPTGPDFPSEAYPSIQLAIVPGMSFDDSCHRLGRGKGYYDRLLPQLPEAYLIGICFPFQHQPSIPSLSHDIVMHQVIY